MPNRSRATRSSVLAWVGIGANQGRPEQTFADALRALCQTPGVGEVATSPVYRTRPCGGIEQPDFLNAVLGCETTQAPLDFLETLQALERRFGRVRGRRWGPRTLDLDLLLYGDQVIDHPWLCVPHPELHRRGFVLVPLAGIAPATRHPVLGRSIGALRAEWRAKVTAPDREVRPLANGAIAGWPSPPAGRGSGAPA